MEMKSEDTEGYLDHCTTEAVESFVVLWNDNSDEHANRVIEGIKVHQQISSSISPIVKKFGWHPIIEHRFQKGMIHSTFSKPEDNILKVLDLKKYCDGYWIGDNEFAPGMLILYENFSSVI